MPVIIKDFTWHQTPSSISIVVPIRGLSAQKTDVLTSNNYIRIHCHPHIFEAFLWGQVDDENGSCTIDYETGSVFLNFPKSGENSESDSNWPFLEAQGLDRMRKKVIRDAAVNTVHQRHQKIAQHNESRRYEDRQMSIREQIRLDEEERQRVAEIKKAEADKALKDVHKWADEGKMLPGETHSRVTPPVKLTGERIKCEQITNNPGGGATAERILKRSGRRLKKGTETLEDIVKRGPASVSFLSSDEDDNDKKIGDIEARRYLEKACSMQPKKSSLIWPELGGGDAGVVEVRESQRIKVKFTPREFTTPARESNTHLEEEWLKKQAEARRLSGFNEPDLRPEEKNPDWLLDKARSLMKADCHLGAVSALSLGIKLAPKMPELYTERGDAHLKIGNFLKAVEDSSQALELFTPKVVSNASGRLKCHLIRADGFRALKMHSEEFDEVLQALKINPNEKELKNRSQNLKTMLEKEENSDSDVN